MIYPSNFEEKIGFLQLRQYLKDRCISPLGVKKCDAMSFLSNYDKVNSRLLQTHEMLTILNGEIEIPIDNIHDMTQTLSLIRAEGSYMSADNLYKLKTSLDTIRKVHSFFSLKDENDAYVYPNLSELFRSMSVFPTVVASIESILNKFGEIKDTASTTLADIRRSLTSVSNSISSVMRRVVDRAVSDGIIDRDSSPSMRDGRLVIPVAAMMKRKINGIVHDESATGKTVYIEPAEVVEANNRLRELQNEEKREIIKILVAVASEIRPLIDDMLASYSLLGVYDFIRAKAIIARDLGGEMPVLSKKTELEWYHAVHPILLHSLIIKQKSTSVNSFFKKKSPALDKLKRPYGYILPQERKNNGNKTDFKVKRSIRDENKSKGADHVVGSFVNFTHFYHINVHHFVTCYY